ncbi:ATP-binding protein, partial [Streptomyces sp900105245]
QVYDLLLVISELITNAVTHALPPVILHLHALANGSGQVRVHVTDGGPQPTPTTPASWAAARPTDEHGRGATIISALTDHDGTDPDLNGLIDHWADLSAA